MIDFFHKDAINLFVGKLPLLVMLNMNNKQIENYLSTLSATERKYQHESFLYFYELFQQDKRRRFGYRKPIPNKTRINALEISDWICLWCGKEIDKDTKWVLDHIIPLAVQHKYPGVNLNDTRNIRPMHQSCNASKGKHQIPLPSYTLELVEEQLQ